MYKKWQNKANIKPMYTDDFLMLGFEMLGTN